MADFSRSFPEVSSGLPLRISIGVLSETSPKVSQGFLGIFDRVLLAISLGVPFGILYWSSSCDFSQISQIGREGASGANLPILVGFLPEFLLGFFPELLARVVSKILPGLLSSSREVFWAFFSEFLPLLCSEFSPEYLPEFFLGFLQ